MLRLALRNGLSMSTKKFSLGQRVIVNTLGPRGQPGTIIGLGRSGLRSVWLVELDYETPEGQRMFEETDRSLRPLPPEQDPRLGRSMS